MPTITDLSPSCGSNPAEQSTLRKALLAAVTGATLLAAPLTQAQIEWNGSVSTNWFTDDNWDGGATPAAADNVDIDASTPNATVVDGAATAGLGLLRVGVDNEGELTIQNGAVVTNTTGRIAENTTSTGSVTVDNATWNNSGGLVVGNNGTGTLTISNNGQVSSTFGTIGDGDGSSGTVTVDGANSMWSMTSGLTVGGDGQGALIISDGGAVITDGQMRIGSNTTESIGNILVTGADSLLENTGGGSVSIGVGDDGHGTLTIADGGTVITSNPGRAQIASSDDSTGQVLVTGSGSTWDHAGELHVGRSGSGTLAITDGGEVSNTGGVIGLWDNGSGSVTVDGAGSTWTNSSSISVGDAGVGTLTISDGGMVSNGVEALIGNASGGEGAVVVSGLNSLWENAGALAIGQGGSGTLQIENGATVTNNNQGVIGNFSGSVGEVTVQGTGSSWANANTLTVGWEGAGALTIADGATVDVTGAGNIHIGRDLGGEGILNIGAAAATPAAAPGTLNAAEVAFGDGDGLLVFNHTADDYHFSPELTGGGLAQVLAGTTTLSGDSSSFGGATEIAGGLLRVNGALGGNINVLNSGTLGGSGSVGTTEVAGTVAPGNSIGTLSVDGDLTLLPGSLYQVELNRAGASDLLNISGSATINGGSVEVIPLDSFARDTPYTIMTAAGGISGDFDALLFAPDSDFLSSTLNTDANDVFLIISQTASFASAAQTPNQRAVATALDSDAPGIIDIIDALLQGSAASARSAFDSLSGVQHSHAQTVSLQAWQQFQGLLGQRLGGFGTAAQGGGASADDNRWGSDPGVWLRGFGGFGEIDDSRNASGADYSGGGIAAGVDTELDIGRDEMLIAGAAFGYSRSSIDANSADLDIDSLQLAMYSRMRHGDYYLNSNLGIGYHDTDSKRRVVGGSIARADYSSWSMGLAAEVGRDLPVLDAHTVLTPFIALSYAQLRRESFNENGAGSANLRVASQTQDSLRSHLGARLSRGWTTATGIDIRPGIELAWVQEYLDTEATVSAGFAEAPGTRFSIDGPKLNSSRARLGAGVSTRLNEAFDLDVRYNAELASSDSHHHFDATLRWRW